MVDLPTWNSLISTVFMSGKYTSAMDALGEGNPSHTNPWLGFCKLNFHLSKFHSTWLGNKNTTKVEGEWFPWTFATCGWILYSKIPDSHRPAGHFYLYGKKVDHHFYRVTEGSLSHWMSHFFLGEAHQTSHFCFPLENEMPFNFQIHSTLSSNLQNIQNFKKTFLIKLRPMSIIYLRKPKPRNS